MTEGGSDRGLPTVAIVGRQNVGKSTLVNRLFGRTEAIAHELPGVTRDRIEIPVTWRDRTFLAIDTGGYTTRAHGIEALVASQAERAVTGADVVVLVADVQTGIQEEDVVLAKRLRPHTAPVVLVVNKVDSDALTADVAAFHGLGVGEPVPISALHGTGSGDLLDRIVELLPEGPPEVEAGEARLALVGRPNVGKSSLFNKLVGEERSVVFEESGTTRDAVDALVAWGDRTVRFVDTAGLRRAGRMQGVDYYGLVRAVRAIERAHIALLVLDASEGLTGEDKRIAERVMEAGRGLAIAANKWDLLARETRDALFKDLTVLAGAFAGAEVVRTSALTGVGVGRLPGLLLGVQERWNTRIPTAEVNRVLQEAQAERPPPRGAARLRYATQVGAGPPTFVLFGGGQPPPGYRRFLENRLRRAFGFQGVPIRLRFRSRKARS